MLSPLLKTNLNSALVLADGSCFLGTTVGAIGKSVGEIVFNTAMTGYQETITDPSYKKQIITFTYPHIGNYGVNQEDCESAKVQAAGLVIKDLSLIGSNFRSQETLSAFLVRHKTVAIAGVDTRGLTRLLRFNGAQNGCIFSLERDQTITQAHVDEALILAKAEPSMAGQDLAQIVSCDTAYSWSEGVWFNNTSGAQTGANTDSKTGFYNNISERFHVVAVDFGVKRNILRMLAQRGCRITVVPAKTSAAQILAMNPDGVFLSNGPGDPQSCDYAILATQEIIEKGVPIFGICLGHQILALACGAKTFKMKVGHHGANHPVQDVNNKRVYITSQNHGFAVDKSNLPNSIEVTHVSLFDKTIAGFALKGKPVFGFQGHPEASPGPHDIGFLFDRFTQFMEQNSCKTSL